MKKFGKIAGVFAVILLLAASPAFTQNNLDLGKVQSAMNSFSESIAKALPFNSTVGLNWSDAYIGQLIDAPPHFGLGMTVGVTSLNSAAISSILDSFGAGGININLPVLGFPLPAYTFEARLGGFGIPFDLGFKFGTLDTSKMKMFDGLFPDDMSLDYLLIGGDFRYALIDSKGFPVKLSIGLGFNHLRGGIKAKLGEGMTSTFDDGIGNSATLKIDAPILGLTWKTNVIEAKVHISFPLVVITPYVGIGASYSWSEAGYQVKSKVKVSGTGPGGSDINKYTETLYEQYGITGLTKNGFESVNKINGFNVRAFGGLSLNLWVIKLDLTVMFNIFDQALGATVGLRFQL